MAAKRKRAHGLTEILEALHSWKVGIELRDDRQLSAVLDGVDSEMNLSLSEATWTAGSPFDDDDDDEDSPVWLSARSLRYVVLPSNVDPIEAIERHREKVRAAKAKYARGIRPGSKREREAVNT